MESVNEFHPRLREFLQDVMNEECRAFIARARSSLDIRQRVSPPVSSTSSVFYRFGVPSAQHTQVGLLAQNCLRCAGYAYGAKHGNL